MCFCISRSVENSLEMVSNEAAMFTLLSHANLADILGDADFDFECFFVFWNLLIPHSQNSTPLDSKIDELLLSQLRLGVSTSQVAGILARTDFGSADLIFLFWDSRFPHSLIPKWSMHSPRRP